MKYELVYNPLWVNGMNCGPKKLCKLREASPSCAVFMPFKEGHFPPATKSNHVCGKLSRVSYVISARV